MYFDEDKFDDEVDACRSNTKREQDNSEVSDLVVYPNPSTGLYNLNVTLEESSIKSLQVIDQNGQVILGINKGNIIDLSGQSNGVYILQQINQDGNIHYQKIILVK